MKVLSLVKFNKVVTYWNKAAEKTSEFAANPVIEKFHLKTIPARIYNKNNNFCTRMLLLNARISSRNLLEIKKRGKGA